MDYDWIEMMNYMQNLRQFCSRNVRRTEKGSISTSQELDLLSRISLSDVPLTPHEHAVVWDLANLQSAV